jgi:hypothetical protein
MRMTENNDNNNNNNNSAPVPEDIRAALQRTPFVNLIPVELSKFSSLMRGGDLCIIC